MNPISRANVRLKQIKPEYQPWSSPSFSVTTFSAVALAAALVKVPECIFTARARQGRSHGNRDAQPTSLHVCVLRFPSDSVDPVTLLVSTTGPGINAEWQRSVRVELT